MSLLTFRLKKNTGQLLIFNELSIQWHVLITKFTIWASIGMFIFLIRNQNRKRRRQVPPTTRKRRRTRRSRCRRRCRRMKTGFWIFYCSGNGTHVLMAKAWLRDYEESTGFAHLRNDFASVIKRNEFSLITNSKEILLWSSMTQAFWLLIHFYLRSLIGLKFGPLNHKLLRIATQRFDSGWYYRLEVRWVFNFKDVSSLTHKKFLKMP